MGYNGHGNRQIRARSNSHNDYSKHKDSETRRKHADQSTDGVNQIDPIEYENPSYGIRQTSTEEGTERDSKSQGTGHDTNLAVVQSHALLPNGNCRGKTHDDAGP